MSTPITSIRFTDADKADLAVVRKKFGLKNSSATVRLGFRILIRLAETPEGVKLVNDVKKEVA